MQKGASRMKPDVSALATLMLGTVMLTGTGALPAPQAPNTLADPKNLTALEGCQLAPFQSLSPQELKAFRSAKIALEDMILQKPWNCTTVLFPRTWDLRHLQVWERPVALNAELTLTLVVLETVAEPSLKSVLARPLNTLHYIQAHLETCVPPEATGTPQPQGLLYQWLQRIHEAPQKESLGCLEASVTLNLIRLLTRDLRCVARGTRCV